MFLQHATAVLNVKISIWFWEDVYTSVCKNDWGTYMQPNPVITTSVYTTLRL